MSTSIPINTESTSVSFLKHRLKNIAMKDLVALKEKLEIVPLSVSEAFPHNSPMDRACTRIFVKYVGEEINIPSAETKEAHWGLWADT